MSEIPLCCEWVVRRQILFGWLIADVRFESFRVTMLMQLQPNIVVSTEFCFLNFEVSIYYMEVETWNRFTVSMQPRDLAKLA